MEKKIRRLNRTLFDVAGAPTILFLFGTPLFIAIMVAILVVIAILLIRKAHIRNQQNGKNSDPQ